MKIKSDFVTNSSSSAFIVVWPCMVKAKEDVARFIKRLDFQKQIFKDCLKQKPIKVGPELIPVIATNLRDGYNEEIETAWDHNKAFCKREGITEKELWENRAWQEQADEELEYIQKQQALEISKNFIEGKDGYTYFFQYGDNDGEFFSDLEHENDWGGLPHIRISQH